MIILLGGVGDERAVEPIIHGMAEKGENPEQERLNLGLSLQQLHGNEILAVLLSDVVNGAYVRMV